MSNRYDESALALYGEAPAPPEGAPDAPTYYVRSNYAGLGEAKQNESGVVTGLACAAMPGPVNYAVSWGLAGTVLGLVGTAVYASLYKSKPDYTKGAGYGTLGGAAAGVGYYFLRVRPAKDKLGCP